MADQTWILSEFWKIILFIVSEVPKAPPHSFFVDTIDYYGCNVWQHFFFEKQTGFSGRYSSLNS
jgi:hypothetical protein